MSDDQQKQDTMWYIDGVKGFYSGYKKAFYKLHGVQNLDAKCLDDDTVNNIVMVNRMLDDPTKIFDNIADVKGDFNKFTAGAEIFENLMQCHFEESVLDLMNMCTKEPSACLPTTVTQNLSKSVFILVGKFTSLAEIMKDDFPSKDGRDFQEQTREIGETAGTVLRAIFKFRK